MAHGIEVTIAGKRYENAAAYIQSVLGSLRTLAGQRDGGPVEVTVRPDEELDADAAEALL